MAMIDPMVMEFEHEAANTRKVLERVPIEEKRDFKPAEKSMTLHALASHLATVAEWAATTCQQDVFDLDPDNYNPWGAKDNADLLSRFDENVKNAVAAMKAVSDEQFMATWKMTMKGNPMMEMPRAQVLRGMILNHMIHHRAQLTVYLRMLDVALPSLYGPTADESPN